MSRSFWKEVRGITIIMCLMFSFFAASGSIYFNTKVVGIAKIDIILLLLVFCVIWISKSNYISLSPMHFWVGGLIVIYFINNATQIGVNDFPMLLLYPVMLCMILTSYRMPVDWFEIELLILKMWYIFYALYTILMRISPVFLQIALEFFPNQISRERMIKQYSNGCMVGFTTHYSTNGMLLAVGAIIFFTEMLYRRKWKNAFWSFVFAISLLLTGKRAHVIFTFVAVLLGYYVNESADKKKRRQKIIMVVIAVLVALYIIIQYIPALSTFLVRFAETEEEGDITLGRTTIWKVALEVFAKSPLFGIGWGQFANQGYLQFNAHNIYVQLLCETGMIGSGFYFSFFAYMLIKTWTMLRKLRENNVCTKVIRLLLYSLSFQVFFLLYGLTGNPLYDQIMYIPYFFACSITLNAMNGRFEEEAV